jgi:hypothetical protein
MASSYGIPLERLLQGNVGEKVDHIGPISYTEDNIEQQLLSMFRKLSIPDKYRLLGYIERICVEDMDDSQPDSVIQLRTSAAE